MELYKPLQNCLPSALPFTSVLLPYCFSLRTTITIPSAPFTCLYVFLHQTTFLSVSDRVNIRLFLSQGEKSPSGTVWRQTGEVKGQNRKQFNFSVTCFTKSNYTTVQVFHSSYLYHSTKNHKTFLRTNTRHRLKSHAISHQLPTCFKEQQQVFVRKC